MNSGAQGEAKTAEQASEQSGLLALLADPAIGIAAIPMPRIGGEPPKEFRAFKWGDNPTTKGTLKLTLEGAQKLMDSYRARNHVLCFDYFHSTYNPMAVGESKKAAGQFEPEIRGKPGDEDGGLWYARIQWTPKAAQGIRDGEWPFISPAVIHDKGGVIYDHKNAGLVTDPGTIGAQPLVLSDSEPPKRNTSMADDKRMACSGYAALEGAFRHYQDMANTDGAEKEFANAMIGRLAPAMDEARGYMQGAGLLDAAAQAGKAAQAGEKMMATLSADLGESDPDKLYGKLMARLDGAAKPEPPPEGTVLLSKEDASALSKLLLAGYANKVPTVKRAAVEAMPLTGQVAYLSAAAEITPSAPPVREAPPLAPTLENTQAALKNAPPIKTGASMAQQKTLATLDAGEKTKLEGYLDTARSIQGERFKEEKETQAFLSMLSDYEPPKGDEIRQLPVGDDGHITTLAGGGR